MNGNGIYGGMTEAQLGMKLTEARADKPKIFLWTAIRTTVAILLSLAGTISNGGFAWWFASLRGIMILTVLWMIFLAFGLFPLVHLRQYLIFYQYGFCYCGRNYLFSQTGSVRFRDIHMGLMTHCRMQTEIRSFDVTWIKQAVKQYNRAYFNQAEMQSTTFFRY